MKHPIGRASPKRGGFAERQVSYFSTALRAHQADGVGDHGTCREPVLQSQFDQHAAGVGRELQAGADFRQMAIAHSSDSRALEGGDLGWRKAGELPSLFAEQVFALEVGQTAAPIRSGSGFHIVQLLEKRGAGTEVVEQALVRHILVKPSEIRSEADTQALIEDIHKRLVAGEDFGALARLYSEDPGSALAGGDDYLSKPFQEEALLQLLQLHNAVPAAVGPR